MPDDVQPVHAAFSDEQPTKQASESSADCAKPDGSPADMQTNRPASGTVDDDLLEWAKEEDVRHWAVHRRPISADTLRRKLRIGAARSRLLVAMIRADSQGRSAQVDPAAQARA
jgi:hypothetical protein